MAKENPNRRSFLSNGLAVSGTLALSASSYTNVLGANDRVGVGFIGYGLIGKRHVIDFKEQKDVNAVAVCDVHRGRQKEAVDFIGGNVKGCTDFRKLLENKDVQAVVVSTPDHWHALMTMLGCEAGKDVYVEKPLTLFPREGSWMLKVAKRNKSVVQVGTQQRSGKHYQRAKALIEQGHIGKVMAVKMQAARNIMPGYGNPRDGKPPAEMNYDLWLGPAPKRAYNPNRAIYHFRWFWDYSGGQMTNLGQHSLDIVDWILGVSSLKQVVSLGGRFSLKDNGETPDTQDAIFQFDGWTATWSHREASNGEEPPFSLELYGTKGSLGINRKMFRVIADKDVPSANTVPQFTGAHPVGGPQSVKVKDPNKLRTKAITDRSGNGRTQFKDHVRNFLDCIKSRKQPISDLESGHRVATVCHLANLALRLGRPIKWSFKTESILEDKEAAKWLVRPYRSPWDKELRALKVE